MTARTAERQKPQEVVSSSPISHTDGRSGRVTHRQKLIMSEDQFKVLKDDICVPFNDFTDLLSKLEGSRKGLGYGVTYDGKGVHVSVFGHTKINEDLVKSTVQDVIERACRRHGMRYVGPAQNKLHRTGNVGATALDGGTDFTDLIRRKDVKQ